MVPPTSARLASIADWGLDPGAAVLILGAGAAYAIGVRRLAVRGRRWPAGRTGLFAGGLGVVVLATQSGLARYDTILFSAHAAQHVLLGMLAPLLLALGAPITLALQAAHRPTQERLARALHHPVARVLVHPVVAWLAYVAVMVGL